MLLMLWPIGLIICRIFEPILPADVKVVHLIQSNHLDIGFSDFASNVVNRYFTGEWGTAAPPAPRNKPIFYPSFFLNAANTSRLLRKIHGSKGPRYRYMVNSWLVDLFLDCNNRSSYPKVPLGDRLRCPGAEQVKSFLEAIVSGDAWLHAFPHSSQPELMDNATILAGIELSRSLARKLGKDPPSIMSQRDVPGLSRGIVPILAQNGIVGISVGANDASPAPLVPSTYDCAYAGKHQIRIPFLWKDEITNTSIILDIHPGGYGGELPFLNPSSNSSASYFSRDGILCDCVGVHGLGEIACYSWRGDNYGPADVNETEANFHLFAKAFPDAKIMASTLDDFFSRLNEPEWRKRLPVVTSEIGDSWIYGISSDPLKLAQMRAMMRARTSCLDSRECRQEDPKFNRFTHMMLKLTEHTWGGSYAGHMNMTQPQNWSNEALFDGLRGESNDIFYKKAPQTWEEQRKFIWSSLDYLDPNSSLKNKILSEFQKIVEHPRFDGYNLLQNKTFFRLSDNVNVSIDKLTGALNSLCSKSRCWTGSNSHQLVRLIYRTYSYAEKCERFKSYTYSHRGIHPYNPGAFVPPTPGLNTSVRTRSKIYFAPVSQIYGRKNNANEGSYSSLLLRLDISFINDSGVSKFKEIYMNLTNTHTDDVHLDIIWIQKTPTRLPESLSLEFRPAVCKACKLRIMKIGQPIDVTDVVIHAGRALHGLDPSGKVTWTDCGEKTLAVRSADAALVAPGPSLNLYDWNVSKINPQDGLSFNLFNNLYYTNYILWYPFNKSDNIMRFRFTIYI
eukprot:UC4_evm4s1289